MLEQVVRHPQLVEQTPTDKREGGRSRWRERERDGGMEGEREGGRDEGSE